jgi:adenylate cyclase
MDSELRSNFFNWISQEGNRITKAQDYIYEYIQFLNTYGYSIIRVSLGGSSLHPEVEATGYNYTTKILEQRTISNIDGNPFLIGMTNYVYAKGTVINTRFKTGVQMAEQFQNSPIPQLWIQKEKIHIPIWKTNEDPYPVISDLRQLGATAYFAMPLMGFEGVQAYASFSTTRQEGFSDSMIEDLIGMTEIFAMGWHRFRLKDTMSSLLGLYLGPMTAPKVLSGKIRRGDVEELESIIWFSDIRGYSALSSQTDPYVLIDWLNQYYEDQIKNIHRFGGEVLKIMGDGMLAVFPTTQKNKMKTIARRSLLAAKKSLDLLRRCNEIRVRDGHKPLQHGIALHPGKVQYGNIGSNDRLDFTIIGNDVNLTARISSLCGSLQEDVLVSEEMTKLLPGRTELVKEDVILKGIIKSQNIYKSN